MKKSGTSLTLKRTVTIKAIVTEDFKKYIAYELQEHIKSQEQRLKNMETKATELINAFKQKGAEQQVAVVQQQLENESTQIKNDIKDSKNKIERSKQLELGTLFTQGAVEGIATIKPGDNLYKKLGSVEVIIKDGIVQEFRQGGEPWAAKT